MRKISIREKVFLSIGFLAIVGVFVYFILLPILQKSNSGSKSSMQEMQERLKSMEKLGSMAPIVAKLEARMKEQTGYKDFVFKQGIADSMIIKYVSQTASQAGINEIDQLDPKPDTSKKASTEAKADQNTLALLVNHLYILDVMDQMEGKSNPTDESNQPAKPNPGDKEENEDEKSKLDDKGNDQSKADEAEKPGEVINQITNKFLFPVIPKDISEEARQSMVRFIEANQGKTLTETDINEILDKAGLKDEEEKVENRLKMYSTKVKEAKSDLQKMINELGLMRDSNEKKRDRYIVKMVFKSKMEQLVRLLYNLQNSARWLKVDSMNISVSDTKQAILSVELSMTANVLYE